MDQKMVLQLMLCVASAVVGVLIGLRMGKWRRKIEWRRGYAAGIEVFATAVEHGANRATDERMREVYLLPVAGVERIVKQAKEPEAREGARKKQEK